MAYAGRQPITGFRSTPTKDSFNGDNSTTEFTLSIATRTNDVEVFVENVQQEPVTAYSISGNTLTFTSAPPTGTDNIYVIHRAELVSNGVHTPGANLEGGVTTLDSLTVTGATDIDTSLNVDGTVTADGLTVDGTENITYSRNADEFTGIELSNTNSGAGSFSGISYGTNGSGTQQWFVGRENQSSAALQFCPATAGTPTVVFEYGGNVGIGTSSPNGVLELHQGSTVAATSKTQTGYPNLIIKDSSTSFADERGAAVSFEGIYGALSKIAGVKANGSNSGSTRDFGELVFYTHGNSAESGYAALNEAMRIDSSSNLLVGKTSAGGTTSGVQLGAVNNEFVIGGGTVCIFNRNTNDGTIISLRQGNTQEGTISVSGTTVSYNGGHLARWSRLADDSKDTSIVKGTVMTNLDAMVEWSHDAVEAVEAQDAVYDDDGNVVTEAVEAVEAKEAYTEDNEQLNKMAVSSVEGDPNVAGVFVNWDDDDDFNDMNIAMTGDMVIRIAQGTTVARGDLLMSAGDGTAKPQGDDIVRSKTIAKVTSTHVSHTYDDGSYLVPCVLMAC